MDGKTLIALLARDMVSTVNAGEKKIAETPDDNPDKDGMKLELMIYQCVTNVLIHAMEIADLLQSREDSKSKIKLLLPH